VAGANSAAGAVFHRTGAPMLIHNVTHEKCTSISREDVVRDLGVIFDEKINFREHIHYKINMAYKMVGLIKRNYKYLSTPSFVLVYKNLVRSHLDYCNCVWNPYRLAAHVQMSAIK